MVWGLMYFYSAPWYCHCLKKKMEKRKLAEPVCCTAKANWKASEVFLPAVQKSRGKKRNKKMLYIFHITCCKVLICEALIKTLLNDLWIAISHSAFLLFYTFLWVTIAAINFVCILLKNQLHLKTVHRVDAYPYGLLKRLFSAQDRKSKLMLEFLLSHEDESRDIPPLIW